MKRIVMILLLAGCPKPKPEVPDAAVAVAPAVQPAEGAFVLTPQMIDAYLRYQRAWATGTGPDSGRAVENAEREEAALKASGLSDVQLQRIDEMVAAVVARRMAAPFLGEQGLVPNLAAMGGTLNEEQKKRLEEAVAAFKKQQQAAKELTEERKRFGTKNIDLVLAREPELIKAWTEMMGLPGLSDQIPAVPQAPK